MPILFAGVFEIYLCVELSLAVLARVAVTLEQR